ncbi:MAG: MerR family transcriptional regulator [Alphaproteobacteria bacterium]|nr:MerR family transcriptional regulator [Alphaproteobacteria bacterium]
MENNDLYFVPINEVAKRLDIPAYTLRYWERQFGSAIKPTTGSAGRRYYRPEVVEKIATIKTLLYDRGMTIAGVKKMIHNGEFSEIENIAPTKPETITPQKIDDSELDIAIDLLKQAGDLL